jgi:hypothetical protein
MPANPKIGVSIVGQPGYLVEDITLSNVSLQFAGGGDDADSEAVMQDAADSYPEYTNFGVTPAYGLNLRHVNNVVLHNVKLSTIREDARPAIFFEDAKNITITDLKAKMSATAKSFIRFKSVENIYVHSCKPDAVQIPFLSFEEQAKDVSIINNDLHKVASIYVKTASIDKQEIYTNNNRR